MKRTVPSILVLSMSLAACGGSGAASSSSSADASPSAPPPTSGGDDDAIEHPTGAEPVLVVEEAGGFVMVDMVATRLPSFVMLGDGRVIVQGMQTLEFPGPALPALQERTLTEQGIQEVLSAVESTNLFTSDMELRGAQAMVADASDTVFRLNAAGREVTITVYALGLLGPDAGNMGGIGAAEIEAHQALSQLRDALMTIDTSLSADAWETEGWQAYEPEALRLYVRDVTDQPVDVDVPEQVRDWPTDDDPAAFGAEAAVFGDGTRCGVVQGEAAATWLAELGASNQMTRWTDDGERRFSVLVRPLLPGEQPACPEPVG